MKIAYLYNHSINFLPTEKIKSDFLMSENFLSNMYAFLKNQRVIHHSHVTGKIISYAHNFCNLNVKRITLQFQYWLTINLDLIYFSF